ncbi:MAG: CRISPR-associated helicase Cas3' [Streptosporangiaceae bacterium]
MDDELWAHSMSVRGVRHRLADHLRGTAALARTFGDVFGAGDLAGYLGLTHDVGKGEWAWQRGLLAVEGTGGPVGIDHKSCGTWLAQRVVGPFAMCIDGHHGGLPALDGLQGRLLNAGRELESAWEATAARVADQVPEIAPGSASLLPAWCDDAWANNRFAVELLMRMVFSCLVDADYLDTEAHFNGAPRPVSTVSIGSLADRYEARCVELLAGRKPSPADQWRAGVYEEAVARACGPRGMYRLAAPTGSGKTITAGGFAIRHARAHGLRRVVLAVPFISITEQNAAEYCRLLDEPGSQVVLEHHSGTDLDGTGGSASWWRKLAAENWDAPFVVTTTVQLLQSLFDHRPWAMRKLHRLAGSVIVLDEVQALPDRLLMPILSALRLLTERFGSTVLLASATQPSYWSLKPFADLPVHDLISDPRPLYEQFRRVRYEWRTDPEPSMADIAAEVAAERQVLVVVNTTADSATLHRLVEAQRSGPPRTCLHLSTRMTAQHRRDVLERVRRLLEDNEPVALVSTQLVEAGVDVDFPVVYRAWAPADSLQQAAGRANRNARLTEGRVVIFRPADGGQPRDASYTAALAATEAHFGPGRADPDCLAEVERYYPERYTLQDLEHASTGAQIEALRSGMDFPAVAQKFQLIEDKTVSVAVPYPAAGEARDKFDEIVRRLRAGGPGAAGEARQLLRVLRPFMATVPKRLALQAQDHGLAEPIIGDLLEWQLPYHPVRGIDPAELPELNTIEVHIW